MFRLSLNRAVVRFRLETVTPLLIKAGDSGLTPTAADLSCVRTRLRGDSNLATVYIPGSSLRGVLRSTAESLVRGRRPQGVEGACDPLGPTSCGSRRHVDRDGPATHKSHCLACRLFGSTSMKGRASVRDLFPWKPDAHEPADEASWKMANRTEVRHGVAINRFSGSVEHGPFDLELVPPGARFWGEVLLVNYQAWQLGLLGSAIEQVNEGFAQLGSSKSRGLGAARIDVYEVVHEQTALRDAPSGVGLLAEPGEAKAYGLLADSTLGAAQGVMHGLVRRFRIEAAQAGEWVQAATRALEALG